MTTRWGVTWKRLWTF